MKFFLKIDEVAEPSVTVVCSKVTDTVRKIEELCREDGASPLVGYGVLYRTEYEQEAERRHQIIGAENGKILPLVKKLHLC